MEGVTETKCGAKTEGKAIQWLSHLGIHPIYKHQTQAQFWMPTRACWQESGKAISWEALPVPDKYRSRCSQPSIGWNTRVPNEGDREKTQGAEGVCSPIGGTTIWSYQYPQSSLGLNHQSKKTHRETHGSSCICSRGWPSRSSMRGEALGPVKALCPSVGECQGQEAGVGELVSRRRGEGIEGFRKGNQERG